MRPGDLEGLHRLDAEAYRRLIRAYQDRLYRYLVGTTGDPDTATELLAETFASLVDAFHRRRIRPDDLTAYVFGVARNHLRHHWRRPAVSVVDDALLHRIEDPAQRADARVAAQQELDQVLALVAELDDEVREVFVLRFVDDMPLSAIAELTGHPLGTIKSHIHRARNRIRSRSDETGRHARPRRTS